MASLNELTGAVRDRTAAAIAAAEAAEIQAIASEKVERVAAASREIESAIELERRRAEAIDSGTAALQKFEQAESQRQEIERIGLTLAPAQIEALQRRLELAAELQAINDNADFYRQQAEELRLLVMTNEERDLELRLIRIRNELLREGKEIVEAQVEARARVEQGAYKNAEAIQGLKEDLRRAFVETGELAFDDVADYAARRLREAVYEALLAKPIDVMINAVVGGVSGMTGTGGLGGLLGSVLGSFLGEGLGGAFTGHALGQAMGLGTGKPGADAGLSLLGGIGGTALAYSGLSAGIAGGVTAGALSMGASATLAGSMGALLSSAAVLGPLGAIAGLALGTLFKDDQRPYARSDIGIVNGQFSVTGGQSLDGGPLDQMNQAAAQIVASLNAATDLFKLDLSKVSNLPTSIGYVEGKNTGALSQGYFGGDGGGFSTGAQFEGYTDASKLAADIVKATIIRAIEAGASDLSEAEKRVVTQAASLEDAATKIALGRSIVETIDDAILQLTDPAAFERKKALDAIEQSYQALKAQAEELIAAGLVSSDVLAKIDQVKQLQVADALANLGGAVADATAMVERAWQAEQAARTAMIDELLRAADQLASYGRSLYLGPAAGLSPEEQYNAAKGEFERVRGLAMSGDAAALAQLPTTSQQFLEASRAYYASSAEYFRDLEAVRSAVSAAEMLARAEAEILQAQLDVQKEMLKALIGIEEATKSLPDAIAALIAAKAAAGGAGGSASALPEGFNWEVYAANNPDLLAARRAGTALTEFATDREAIEQHYLLKGKDEIAAGTRFYAKGGVFTNQVVTRPTTFDIGMMAEAGPEAIMPLFQGPRGLGVVVSSSSGRTDALLEQVIVELQALVRQGGAASVAQLQALGQVAEELAANSRELARAA